MQTDMVSSSIALACGVKLRRLDVGGGGRGLCSAQPLATQRPHSPSPLSAPVMMKTRPDWSAIREGAQVAR